MANDHPFQMLFETLGRIPTSHAESVNRHAYEILCDLLSVPIDKPGRCILLRAPRAGHGKTHLLSRIQHYLGSTHEFIALHPTFGSKIDAASVTDDALRRLVRPLPASGGLCVLDLITRRLFAAALQPLVGSGEVPCQDREGALTALRTRPIETFDFHHPNAVTAHWARENFEVLGQRLSLELAQRCGLPVREVAFWVDALFRFAATPIENPGRARALSELVHTGAQADGEAMERLAALLGLVSLLMRVVLVADDLEGFSADENAALRLASFLGSLRQSVERLDVVLSLNQDIWQSAFMPRLSGGLSDRLSEVVIELNPLTHAEMVALLDSRVPGLGSRVLDRIDVSESGTHARGLIRAAGLAWLKATATDSAPPTPPPAAFQAVPPEFPGIVTPPQAVPPPAPETTYQTPAASAPAPPVSEPVPWPAPDFTPAPPETSPSTPLPVEETESPFQFSEPSQWESPVEAPGIIPAVPAPEVGFAAESAPPDVPQVDLPYQPDVPVFAPETAPALDLTQPVVESPFQPQVDSPFQMAQPVSAPLTEQPPFQQAVEITTAPEAPPFQITPTPEPEPIAAASPWAEIAPLAPEPVALDLGAESPFQAASPAWAPGPSSVPGNPSQNFTPPPAPAPEPAYAAPASNAEPALLPPPTATDTDRVDELLRQFRERYGRGSL